MTMDRRSTSRIARELPPEVREQFDQLLWDGRKTYDELTDWLAAQGFEISRASVGRYGKNFAGRLQRFKESRGRAKAIIAEAQGNGLELHEATNQIAVDMISEQLMSIESITEVGEVKFDRLVEVLAKLQGAQVKLADFKRKADKMLTEAEERIKAAVRDEMRSDPELVARVEAIVERVAGEMRE